MYEFSAYHFCRVTLTQEPKDKCQSTFSVHDGMARSFKDKEVQRDAKMVSYKVVDKESKPNIEVEIGGEKKVRALILRRWSRL